MRRYIIVILLSLIPTVASQANAQQERHVRIATEGAFPPWNAVDNSGQAIGFDIDVGKAVCERARLKCDFVTQAWDGIIPALTVGKFDAIMAGMSITEKRRQVIAFSRPYALTSNYFVVARSSDIAPLGSDTKIDLSANSEENNALLRTLKTHLRGKVIGVQGSTNAEAFVHEYFGEAVEIRIYDKQDNLNLDLVAGRIDAGLADFSVWKSFLDTADGAAVELYGPRLSGGLFGPGIGIGLRKTDDELAARFDDALVSISLDGTLRQISLQWFGADLVSQ
ncbi:transporter substrate-binding domain-containing protein [Aliirhizobium smilacinae]|uniref:Transporter substrate-binding domain-containing protein n=1 Tax=Aliirhizobium smilacinae TaxID=1395944 RepID=A0A5C4XA31_9HYPH|nr:transporter substrate-binding domain-containing protein [Rhizobium smilacinae]TNM60345.1 transporter substrate-binding domain-containing protein [Rhizobium smilacinae]